VAGAHAIDVDAIPIVAFGYVCPATAQQIYAVPARDYATENLLKVKLGAAGLRVGKILPVENEYPH
jgi:hypothetical protein